MRSFLNKSNFKTVPVNDAVGMALAHDITEIRKDEFKGRAFKKGYIIKAEDIPHLKKLGKENLYIIELTYDDLHEDDAAFLLAKALMGEGVEIESEPKEGKINIIASMDGLLKINKVVLKNFNMLGDVMCATLHTNTVVKKGHVVAGTRAIPLVIKKNIVEEAVKTVKENQNLVSGYITSGVIEIKPIKKPKVGIVITGNEIYNGIIDDKFASVITRKIKEYDGEVIQIFFSPDDPAYIENKLQELLEKGSDLLITTGGMSVDPDDVTRFAIRALGVKELHYGSAVLPGAMFLIAYIDQKTDDRGPRTDDRSQNTEERGQKAEDRNQTSEEKNPKSKIRNLQSKMIPILGIPACGMYSKITIFDLILPRILAGEHIGRKEIAEMGHGGYCLNCKECRYPVCPFGK